MSITVIGYTKRRGTEDVGFLVSHEDFRACLRVLGEMWDGARDREGVLVMELEEYGNSIRHA